MKRMRVLFLVLAAVMVLSFGATVAAESSFPTKPVRIINYVARRIDGRHNEEVR